MCRDFGGGVLGILGLEEDVEHTTYTVVSSTDGFVTESVVGEFEDNLFPELDNGDYRVYVTNEYGCHDTTAFQVTTTDLVETPFGIEAPESLLQGNGQVPDSVGAESGLSFLSELGLRMTAQQSSTGSGRQWMMWLWRVAMTVRFA